MRFSTLIEGVHIKHVQSTLCLFFEFLLSFRTHIKNGVVYERVPVAYSNRLIPISTVCINAGLHFLWHFSTARYG